MTLIAQQLTLLDFAVVVVVVVVVVDVVVDVVVVVRSLPSRSAVNRPSTAVFSSAGSFLPHTRCRSPTSGHHSKQLWVDIRINEPRRGELRSCVDVFFDELCYLIPDPQM